jgi:hypothetical protein
MTINPNVRNVLIVLVIAAIVAIAPGGGTGANVIVQAISLAFLTAVAWVASVLYRQHRSELYALGDARRTALYAAIAVLALTLSGTPKLWATSGGSVAWLILVGSSVYVCFAVVWSARKY